MIRGQRHAMAELVDPTWIDPAGDGPEARRRVPDGDQLEPDRSWLGRFNTFHVPHDSWVYSERSASVGSIRVIRRAGR